MKRLFEQVSGESSIVGYVLLIVLAVGMAAGVYSYLKFYIPKEQPACPDGVSLIVQNASCSVSDGEMSISLSNRGLFSVDGAFIKIGELGGAYKTTINCPNSGDLSFENCSLYFNDGARFTPIEPGESWSKIFAYGLGLENIEIEIEPILFSRDNKTRVLCDKARITQDLRCTT